MRKVFCGNIGKPLSLYTPITIDRMNRPAPTPETVLSRRDYQDILLARMAGGDLYANEVRLKIRRLDVMLDRFSDHPIYPENQRMREQAAIPNPSVTP